MLCGAALMLIRTALIAWLLAPADWLTPIMPLPLLKELPWMAALALIAVLAPVVIFWFSKVVALALVPTAIARLLSCCCWSPAAWLTITLPLYCWPLLLIVALSITGLPESASTPALLNRARRNSEWRMSLPLADGAEGVHTGRQPVVDRVGDAGAIAAAVSGSHAWQAIGVVQARHAGGIGVDQLADGAAGADTGDIAVAQFPAGYRSDQAGWIGVDGDRVGIWLEGRAAITLRLHGTIKDNHSVATGLGREAEHRTDRATDQHGAGKAGSESPHDGIPSSVRWP